MDVTSVTMPDVENVIHCIDLLLNNTIDVKTSAKATVMQCNLLEQACRLASYFIDF